MLLNDFILFQGFDKDFPVMEDRHEYLKNFSLQIFEVHMRHKKIEFTWLRKQKVYSSKTFRKVADKISRFKGFSSNEERKTIKQNPGFLKHEPKES